MPLKWAGPAKRKTLTTPHNRFTCAQCPQGERAILLNGYFRHRRAQECLAGVSLKSMEPAWSGYQIGRNGWLAEIGAQQSEGLRTLSS